MKRVDFTEPVPAGIEALSHLESRRLRLIVAARKMGWGQEDAEDLAQETFLRAVKGIQTWHGGHTFSAWLVAILRHAAYDRRTRTRRIHRETISIDSIPLDRLPNASVDTRGAIEARLLVESGLDHVKPKLRCVVEMVDIHEETYEDTALRLGISIQTVRSRLYRGRRSLERVLIRQGA